MSIRTGTLEEKIYCAMRRSRKSLSISEIHDRVGGSQSVVYAALSDMWEKGDLIRVRRGVYMANPESEKVPIDILWHESCPINYEQYKSEVARRIKAEVQSNWNPARWKRAERDIDRMELRAGFQFD